MSTPMLLTARILLSKQPHPTKTLSNHGRRVWVWETGVGASASMSSAVTVSSTPPTSAGTSSGFSCDGKGVWIRIRCLADQSEESEEQGWALREFEPGNGISLPLSDTPWKQWAMGPGFLIVYSEPGKEGSLNKFQDLYNWHKHGPLPLHHLESFLSDDTATFPCESYTFYTQTVHLAKLHLDESSLSSSLKSGNPTKYLVTHGITWGGDGESEKAAREWAETSVTELKKTEGWVTTRTFGVIAWLP
ncbi:hypothetical protein D9758_016980 [Tetrapyrgos nigripes]|uniref:Uncharacterized protein n=1 Tax=Tetrapyrgos nigripes TaxID=182062 RepID=A0A8H5FI78_9AGAR|nr:hypothetical protein D9758_016980 [Tetrapyrgos nigripes]